MTSTWKISLRLQDHLSPLVSNRVPNLSNTREALVAFFVHVPQFYVPYLPKKERARSMEKIRRTKRPMNASHDRFASKSVRVVFQRLNLRWSCCGCFLEVYSYPVFERTFRASCLDISRGTKDASLLVT